jgi:hypothetical protein
VRTVNIPVDVLSELVDAADFGQDQKSYDAGREDDVEEAADLEETAQRWHDAVLVGLRLLGRG